MALGRRELLLGAGLFALAAGWQKWGVRPKAIDFSAIKGAPGWQFGSAGSFSGSAGSTLVGIRMPGDPIYQPFTASDLDQAVFRDTRRPGHVPIAIFSDFFCPFCRILFARLVERSQEDGPRVTIAWHEHPLLGPNSHFAARAAEAAALQGAYAPFQDALVRTGLRPVPAAMARIAESIGLDGGQLMHDMDGDRVAARLASSARAAQQLGVFATPGLVIGKRVVLGAIERPAMEDLISETASA
ncbi:MAG: DsbA family protein [Aliishimia sp.]